MPTNMEGSLSRAKQLLPLRVVFEGQSGRLTTLLHVTIAIVMVVRIKELESFILLGRIPTEGWVGEVFYYLGCLFTAICGGALVVGVLSPNLRPVTQEDWRRRTCRSIVALVLLDVLVLDTLGSALDLLFFVENERVVSVPATVFVAATAMVCTIWFNTLHVRAFGCCLCCCCGERAAESLLANAERVHRSGGFPPLAEIAEIATESTMEHLATYRTSDENHEAPAASETTPSYSAPILTRDVNLAVPESSIQMNEGNGAASIVSGAESRTRTAVSVEISEAEEMQDLPSEQAKGIEGSHRTRMRYEQLETVTENEFEMENRMGDMRRETTNVRGAGNREWPSLRDLRRLDTIQLVQIGSQSMHRQQSPSSSAHSLATTRGINVETPDERPQAENEARKVPARLDITELVRTFFNSEEKEKENASSGFCRCFAFCPCRSGVNCFELIRGLGEALQNFWSAVREEPGQFRYSVWIKTAFFTSVIVLVYTFIRMLSVLQDLADKYKENKTKFNSQRDCFNTCMVTAGWEDGLEGDTAKIAVKLITLSDSIIQGIHYACWCGYTLGLVVGLYSLVTVLIQHKRLSLAVSDGLRSVLREAAATNQKVENPWPSFQKRYPVLDACLFLANLAGTAVVQLQLVGFLVAVLVCVSASGAKVTLLENFGFYLLAWAIVQIADVVLMRFLRTWLVSADGTHIKHPRWFNFSTVVLSLVNLVVGVFFAVWRLLYSLMSTILNLNRLDESLFTKGKRLDIGHNTFMSMLVLTVLIQDDHDSFAVARDNIATSFRT